MVEGWRRFREGVKWRGEEERRIAREGEGKARGARTIGMMGGRWERSRVREGWERWGRWDRGRKEEEGRRGREEEIKR